MRSQDNKLELLKKRIASLPPEKRAIFERQLEQQKQNQKQSKLQIKPSSNKENLELSYAQKRLWFLSQLEPDNPTYNIAIAWRIQGQLNINIFKQVFLEIIKRHKTLRTTFCSSENGEPKLKINDVIELDLPIVDLQNTSQPELEVKKISQEIAQKPFALAREIPIRLSLIKLNDTESTVIIVLHHIVADGWSRGILLKEFSLLYKSITSNSPDSLDAIEVQYTDFVAWEKEWLVSKEKQIQLDYWRKQLDNLSVLDIPTDLPRPSIQTFQGRTEFFPLSAEITAQLKSLSRQQGVSLFMTLLTAFKILLHRYTGQKDIAIGSPIANRNVKEVTNIIGFFVNTLVLRSDLSKNPSFTRLLNQVKTTTNQAYQHQELPFGKLVEELHPKRNLSHSPLFQVMIQYQNQAYSLQNSIAPEFAIPNLNLTQEWIDTGATKFDLTYHLIERENGIMTGIEYRSDLFYSATIKRMFGHFQTLLTAIIKNPQARISELSILTSQEEKQVLIDWNQTNTKLTTNCLHQLFEQQVKKTPNSIAVESLSKESLTYQKLNQRANQLAIYLRFKGVHLETKVGICLERSPELIISLLAIQKAGGTYIPLDPSYPRSRLKYIINDAQISTILTTATIAHTCLPPSSGNTLICLEKNLPRIKSYSRSNLSVRIHPQNLAYIIYTSGSTGKPKGTMITHQGLVNYLTWAINEYPIAEGNGFPVHSSISFDATITSLYTALLVGQKIILFPEENELETLKDVLNSNNNYSAIKLTPAHLKAIASLSESEETVKPAQTFIIGGEALSNDAIAHWQKRAPDAQFINEYGPTETVVGCCTYEVFKESIFHNQIPIGNPIANTQLYIMDEYLQPVPVGIPGELYIGGSGVARGYLQQPGLTAERFIPNPIPLRKGDWGESIYKTGDLAKYLPDGTIEYLGRLDNQIKIRGYRIELGEIEAVLNNHPDVESALVVAHNERLIAYVILDISSTFSAPPAPSISTELRQFMTQKLPSYMIPGNFVTLNRFPLTPNGKIDRAALIVPDLESREAEIIEPRTEKEHILAKIWREVLNIKKIGVEDNFFELGGDSILSIQIIARARQAGLTLTPKQLFQYQTIAELAAIATENKPIQAEQDLVTGEVPLTPIQHWFFEQDLIDFSHYNQAVLLEVAPNLNPDWLKLALNHLVSHHDALRMRFDCGDSGWTQFNLETVADVELATVDISESNGESVAKEITNTANQLQTSLDISQGKLITGALFRLGSNKSDRLLLIIHHLVVDGVSWRILLEDIAIAYQQLEDNQPLQLPPKTTSYKYWGETLKEYARQIDIKSELDCWLNRNTITPIPVDESLVNDVNTFASIKQVSISLDIENTDLLLTKISKTYNTNVEDILVTALLQSFYSWTNSKELLLDLESYGRNNIKENLDLSRTVGWFTSICPVKLKLNSINQLDVTIKSIKEQLRADKDKGFNYNILKYLDSESSQTIQKLTSPQIAFNYLGQLNPPPTKSIIKSLAKESTGNTRNLLSKRRYLIEINAAIADSRLQINWAYSQNCHHHSTITKLAGNYLKSLKVLIKHCLSPQTGGSTPSDFSAAKVNQNQLDKLMGQINKKKFS